MMQQWVGLGALFACVFLGCFAILQLVLWRRQRELSRLGTTGPLDSTPDLFLGDATPILAGAAPVQGEKREELSHELIQAGFYRTTALIDYAAIRFVLVILPLILGGLLALVVEQGYVWQPVMGALFFAALGYSMPRVYVNYRARLRR